MFDGIDIHLAIPIIRAFSHFALLANVAEDIHRERRRAIHVAAGEPPQDSSLAATYAKLDLAELDSATVADALKGALVSPVITAHPTETRRRTVFVTQHRITELMRLHAEGHTETDDGRNIEFELRRQVLTLWQTALIRLSRLQISDEIDVGAAVLPGRVLRGGPAGQCRGSRTRCGPAGPTPTCCPEPILQPGSWIGGDRDGNPNVTADVVRLATGSAAYTALAHYLAELTALEQELSMSARLITVTPELAELAEGCPEKARADEPYRRALRVIRGRLTATARRDPGPATAARAGPGLAAVCHAGRTAGRSGRRRRVAAHARRCAAGRRPAGPAARRRGRLRVSPVRPGYAAKLRRARRGGRRAAGVGRACIPDYGSLPEDERVELLAAELGTRRPLVGDRARTVRTGPRRAGRGRGRGPRGRDATVPPRCPTTSSRCASRCRTCWRPRSC